MKLPVLLAATLALTAAAPAARADEKSDAILKEVALRAASLTTYAVTMEMRDGKNAQTMQIWMHRPDKLRVEIGDGAKKTVLVFNGASAAITDGGKTTTVPVAALSGASEEISGLATGNLGPAFGGIESTTYVTQKMLDEQTVVDVIDVVGKKPGNSARIYIDNNGQIRKMVGKDKNSKAVMLFLNPVLGEPIPDDKFAIPKDK